MAVPLDQEAEGAAKGLDFGEGRIADFRLSVPEVAKPEKVSWSGASSVKSQVALASGVKNFTTGL